MTTNSRQESLAQFGFSFERGGVHLARSMMLDELGALFQAASDPASSLADYQRAIIEENCLSKRSLRSRQLTLRHLKSLYCLDPQATIFRALRYFWQRDTDGHPRNLPQEYQSSAATGRLGKRFLWVWQVTHGQDAACTLGG
jgi:hypothetical protein